MLSILIPISDILGPVPVLVRAPPVRLIVEPFAFVDVAVRVDQPALAVRLVVLPVPDVFAAVAPDLGAAAVAVTGFVPLALVDGAVV